MLTLDTIEVVPFQRSYEPVLKFTANFTSTNENVLPLGWSGCVALNHQFLGLLTSFDSGKQREEHFSSPDLSISNLRKYEFPLIITLTKTMLHKIEEVRKENKKGDLIIDLYIHVKYIIPEFRTGEANILDIGRTVKIRNSSLFKFCDKEFHKVCKINRMDWLHDYSPIFYTTEYLVVELPIKKSKKVLNKRITSTYKSISEMKDCLENGDWNGVVKASRPIWEAFNSKADISSILKMSGMNEQTVISFETLIKSLFDFSSKFIHVEAKETRKIMEPNAANREDAELIYLISVSIINLLIRKA